MSLINPNMIAAAEGVNALALTMRDGFSCIVRAINFGGVVDAVALHTVGVNERNIFQLAGPAGGRMILDDLSNGHISQFSMMQKLGLFKGIPVAEGETLNITAPGANNTVQVIYDRHDAGDFTSDMVNGRTSKEYQLFQSITNPGTTVADEYLPLTTSRLGNEFLQFPADSVVPAAHRLTLKAFYGSPNTEGNGAAYSLSSRRIRMLVDREDVFDQDRVGFVFAGDTTFIIAATSYFAEAGKVWGSAAAYTPGIWKLENPMVFEAGQEVNVSVLTQVVAGGFPANATFLGMMFDVEMGV